MGRLLRGPNAPLIGRMRAVPACRLAEYVAAGAQANSWLGPKRPAASPTLRPRRRAPAKSDLHQSLAGQCVVHIFRGLRYYLKISGKQRKYEGRAPAEMRPLASVELEGCGAHGRARFSQCYSLVKFHVFEGGRSEMYALRSNFLAFAAAMGVVACAPKPSPAPAPEVNNSAIEKDAGECRTSAEAEAVRRYPLNSDYGVWGGYGTSMSQTQNWVARSNTRDGLFNECMKRKGYTLQQFEKMRK
jgi:hypothetical protein